MTSTPPETLHSIAGASEARPRYLAVRNGTYYYKRKLPAGVRRALNGARKTSDTILKSLFTSDYVVALSRLEQENQRFEQQYAVAVQQEQPATMAKKLPRDSGTTKYLLAEHIPQIVSRYEYGVLTTDDELRHEMTKEERAEHIEYLEDWISEYRECCASEDFSPVEELATSLLGYEKLIAPPGSDVRRQLLWELMSKDIELAEIQVARARGKMHKTPESPPVAPRDLPTLMDLYNAWAKGQKQVRTRDTYRRFVEEFESLFRALPVVSIDKQEHVLGYRDYLASCGLSRDTVKNRIGGLRTLVRFGMDEKSKLVSLVKNPFLKIDLRMIPETPDDELRRSFEFEELRAVFHSKLYIGQMEVRGQCVEVARWGPLVGMFAGPRIEELCQLRVDDVFRINGHWTIRIANLDPEQHLKTPGSYRLVPMHKELIECGFLRFVAKQKLAGNERLFPSLKSSNKYKRYSNAYGKWHSRFLDNLGHLDDELCFHSYRYNFKQQLGLCGATDEVKDALLGHWLVKSVPGKRYMRVRDKQYPFPILVAAIKALRYDEVDLGHLHVSEPMETVEEALLPSSHAK